MLARKYSFHNDKIALTKKYVISVTADTEQLADEVAVQKIYEDYVSEQWDDVFIEHSELIGLINEYL